MVSAVNMALKSHYERFEKQVVKEYDKYTLYKVFGVIGEERTPLYKECENK